jgi:hypothetical protein
MNPKISNWFYVIVLLGGSITALILSGLNYQESQNLNEDCDSKIVDIKRTSLGMLVVSVFLFVLMLIILYMGGVFRNLI